MVMAHCISMAIKLVFSNVCVCVHVFVCVCVCVCVEGVRVCVCVCVSRVSVCVLESLFQMAIFIKHNRYISITAPSPHQPTPHGLITITIIITITITKAVYLALLYNRGSK